jgi:hypothetical protein
MIQQTIFKASLLLEYKKSFGKMNPPKKMVKAPPTTVPKPSLVQIFSGPRK